MAVTRRRQGVPVVGAGAVRLVRQGRKFLLTQGEAVIDVTGVLGFVNHPMGQVSLRLRVVEGKRVRVQEEPPQDGDPKTGAPEQSDDAESADATATRAAAA